MSPKEVSGAARRRSQNRMESALPAATSVPLVLALSSSRLGAWNLRPVAFVRNNMLAQEAA